MPENGNGNGQWQEVRSKNAKKRMRTSSGEESDTVLASTQASTSNPNANAHGNQKVTKQGFPKFKALPTEGITSYAKVTRLEKEWPALRSQVTARPNIYGQWVITPRTEEAYKTLQSTDFLTQLKPEEKVTKYILLHYPMEMSMDHILQVDGVQKATRCQTKDGSPTRQVEVHLLGTKKEQLDLGLWGRFKMRPFVDEPMRCFRCQRFGHHKATCHNPICCAICSGRHETSVCIGKHKDGQSTTARCVNCKGSHHAWNPKCPERLKLIQMDPRQTPAPQPVRERTVTPRDQTISVTVPSVQGAERTVSFAGVLKGAHKRALTPKPQREQIPPRMRKTPETTEQQDATAVASTSGAKKGPTHLVKSSQKKKVTTPKKMVPAQIQTSPVPAQATETQTPRRERKESVTQTPRRERKESVTQTPTTTKEGEYHLSGKQLVQLMQQFAQALAAQINVSLNTEQLISATRTALNAAKFLTIPIEGRSRAPSSRMSVSLNMDRNTSMEIVDP